MIDPGVMALALHFNVVDSLLMGVTAPPSGSYFVIVHFVSVMIASVVFPHTARSSDSKWSPGSVSNSSLAHELWKVPLSSKGVSAPSRPPPGLTGQKQPSSWGNGALRLGAWGSSEPRYTPGQ